jgi:dCMP deaminase
MEHRDYMKMARIAKQDADCRKRKVGAVLVPATGGLVYFGHNAPPATNVSCANGGCHRCANGDKYRPGEGYDKCVCMHAEERAVLNAGRQLALGATVYSTLRPCFQCSRQMLEVGVYAVYYAEDWVPSDAGERESYERLQEGFKGGVHRLDESAEREDMAA